VIVYILVFYSLILLYEQILLEIRYGITSILGWYS